MYQLALIEVFDQLPTYATIQKRGSQRELEVFEKTRVNGKELFRESHKEKQEFV